MQFEDHPYYRGSEYGSSLLSIGAGIGKPGRVEDPSIFARPRMPDGPQVPNRPNVRAPRTGGRLSLLTGFVRNRPWVVPSVYPPRAYGR